MKHYWLIPLTVCTTGCLSNNGLEYESVAYNAQYHLARIRKGMNEREVIQIMHKPYSYESFQVGDDIYDVWFYVTRTSVLDQSRMVPQNLTPLTFKNGILVGTGYSWYYYAMKEQAAESAAPASQSEQKKSQEVEDQEFEQALKSTPTKTLPKETSLNAPIPKTPLGVTEKNFMQVRKGMSEEEVAKLLGSTEDQESLSIGGDQYDFWFYEVAPKKKKGLVKKIPLTFKNGTLVGTTQDDYDQIKGKDQINREAERMQEEDAEQNFDYW
ncbi:MAG: DUF3192 domain-containing protein [Chlamydiales bacterium]